MITYVVTDGRTKEKYNNLNEATNEAMKWSQYGTDRVVTILKYHDTDWLDSFLIEYQYGTRTTKRV